MKIPGAKPHFENIPGVLEDMKKVLESGRLMLGPFGRDLEAKFAEYIGTKYALVVASATAALEIMMRYADIKDKEVIIPANTFIACANTVIYAGGTPVFAETKRESGGIDLEDVKKKVTPKTRAVMAVHLAGMPVLEITAFRDFCREKNLLLIEDCSHAHGAEIDGAKVGSFGDAGCFSFIATKIMTTGTGGIITTNDEKLYEFAKSVRHQGEGSGLDSIIHLGYDWLMDEFSAVLGVHQFNSLENMIAKRNEIAKKFREKIDKIKNISYYQTPVNIRNAYYKFIAYLDDKVDKDKVIVGMKERGIEMGTLYMKLIYQHPVYQNMGYGDQKCPESEEILRHQISLPIYVSMTDEEIDYIFTSLEEEINKNLKP